MRSRLARFLLIFAALWLPLQAVAGIAMELDRGVAAVEAAAPADLAEHCAFHDAAADAAVPAAGDDGCNACGLCHLAGTGYVAVAEVRADALPAGYDFTAPPAAAVPSRSPEPPQHPPKRSA